MSLLTDGEIPVELERFGVEDGHDAGDRFLRLGLQPHIEVDDPIVWEEDLPVEGFGQPQATSFSARAFSNVDANDLGVVRALEPGEEVGSSLIASMNRSTSM
jgi:hypothetical protein